MHVRLGSGTGFVIRALIFIVEAEPNSQTEWVFHYEQKKFKLYVIM